MGAVPLYFLGPLKSTQRQPNSHRMTESIKHEYVSFGIKYFAFDLKKINRSTDQKK